MRRNLLVLSTVCLTVLASSSDAFAQRRSSGGGGRGGNTRSYSSNAGRGNYGSSYGNGYGGGRGYGGYGGGYYGGLGLGLGLGIAPSYYYGAPSYYSDQAYLEPTMPIRQSFYPAPAVAQQSANVTVLVPNADAQVWFDNAATTQRGTDRLFNSPPLEPGNSFTYTIKAHWMANGQPVDQMRRINVQAGQTITVDFRSNNSEMLPLLPRQSNVTPRD
jgi:uncharacterized protein (TIGR03000 family)